MTRELAEITNAILAVVPAEKIFLFGSYARGEEKKDSDYDIYIVLPDNSISQKDAFNFICKNLLKRKLYVKPMDILIDFSTNFNERKQFPTLERTIVKQGEILFEKK